MSYSIFLSDIHMQASRPDISAAFALLFGGSIFKNAQAVYLLGDVLEYWLGDDSPTTGIENALIAMRDLSTSGVTVYLQHGNRDFLIGEDFAAKYQVKLIPDPYIIDLYGTKTALMHGDTLCTDDVDYQKFRKMVRSEAWQQQFLSMSLEQRIATAKQVRATTTDQVAQKSLEIMDVNEQAVAAAFAKYAVKHIIHGHTHRPNVHRYPQLNAVRTVLSDWDKRAHYLYQSATKSEMRYVDFQA